METINLRGNKYAKVSERIKELHKNFDNCSIKTDYEFKDGFAICKAVITPDVDNDSRFFSGHSLGKIGEEKAFEKLESVAVGRALANAGFLADGEIASAEEMERFDINNKPKEKPKLTPDSEKWSKAVENLAKGAVSLIKIEEHYRLSDDHKNKLVAEARQLGEG